MMHPKPVQYEEPGPIRILTDEEKDTLQKKKTALDSLLAEQQIAKYKIDLNLGRGFSLIKPSHGALTFWESGKKFHGGGDCKLYICPGKERGISQCDAFIPDSSQGQGFLFCPKCDNVWKGEDVGGEILARLTPKGWAEAMMKYFIKLELNCDLRIKYVIDIGGKADIRIAASKEQERELRGEALEIPRQKNTRIYLMKDIIRDTAAGAELYQRILAFITA